MYDDIESLGMSDSEYLVVKRGGLCTFFVGVWAPVGSMLASSVTIVLSAISEDVRRRRSREDEEVEAACCIGGRVDRKAFAEML
jgi:hypothetical protein